jgi:NAD(P)-dependent dehydrogenase (short-subunit alcohol dehydrogenase family)
MVNLPVESIPLTVRPATRPRGARRGLAGASLIDRGPKGVTKYITGATAPHGSDVDTDILVNNAGLQHVAPIQEFPPERFSLLLRVMLEAPFRLDGAPGSGRLRIERPSFP